MIAPTLLFLAIIHRRRQARRRRAYRSRLDQRRRRARDRRIARAALHTPATSDFTVLFGSGDDPSLITLTGLDHHAFRYILQRFEPIYSQFTPYGPAGFAIASLHGSTRGRPRSLDAAQCLGLVLAWSRTRGSEFILCMMFGITASVCSLFIRFGRRILIRVLVADRQAAIRIPSTTDIRRYQDAIHRKYNHLHDVFGVMDGLKLYLQQSGHYIMQNMFYNGWKHDHYVGNVFVFVPDGTIAACALNAPGSLHDSQIAEWGGIYKKLQDTYDRCGARCVVDSAFAAGDFPYLIKSSQDYLGVARSAADIRFLRQATSARQAAEWGMRAFQSSFPRLKDRLEYEERGERRLILDTCALLYNLRARLVGINQLRSVYMPGLERNVDELLH